MLLGDVDRMSLLHLYAVLIMLLELNYGHQVYSTVNGIVNTLKHNTTCHLNKVGMRG